MFVFVISLLVFKFLLVLYLNHNSTQLKKVTSNFTRNFSALEAIGLISFYLNNFNAK